MMLAAEADELNAHRALIRQLRMLGHRVHLGYLTGTLDGALSGPGSRHRMGVPGRSSRERALWRRAALRVHRDALVAAGSVLPARTTMALAVRFDPWFRRAARASEVAIALDGDTEAMLESIGRHQPGLDNHGPRTAPAALAELILRALGDAGGISQPLTSAQAAAAVEALNLLAASARWRELGTEALRRAGRPRAAGAVASHAASGSTAPIEDILPGLILRMVLAGHYADALSAARTAASAHALAGSRPVFDAQAAVAELGACGATTGDVPALTAGALAHADTALAAGDLQRAAVIASSALALLFHRELHVDVASTPLVDDPRAYLSCLDGSRVMELLRSPVPAEAPTRAPHPRPDGSAPRVVVLPGSYGKFAAGVVESLTEVGSEVRLLDLPLHDSRWRGVGVTPSVLAMRLGRSLGQFVERDLELEEDLRGADVIFADWADRGAVWASCFAPAGTPVVLRIHSVDALSAWIHLVDWSRVTDLIVVSEHVRDVVVDQLGDRAAGVRWHVMPNVIDTERFAAPKEPGAERTLCVVGWAQRVKDPLFAVEVLAELRRTDPTWRLLLVGGDFAPSTIHTSEIYAAEFRRRALADDVREHIEYTGFTRRLEDHLARAGYVISSSVRESRPVGVSEGAASGAVPVIRDWPTFARRDGARRLFGEDWVVGSVPEAVARVRSVDERGWREESERARTWAHQTLSAEAVRARYQAIVLGSRDQPRDAAPGSA